MTSSRYSKATALALLAMLVLSAAAVPAGAATVSKKSVPDSAAVGKEVTASFTVTELYRNPSFSAWNLTGRTELENVTWTVSFMTPGGETVAKRSYDGQEFTSPRVSDSTDIDGDGQDEAITKLRVTVRGTVPDVEKFTWPKRENFTVAKLVQTRGEGGSTNTIHTATAHHYTTGGEGSPGSKAARKQLNQARKAIDEASSAGADVGKAKSTLQTAESFYELGQFKKAIDKANQAEKQADEARKQKNQSEQTTRYMLYGGAVLVVLALIGGGVWYWRSQGEEYDKLG